MAQHLEDVYLRRTGRMLFSRDNCRNWLEPLASEMAGLLGWSAERPSEEIAHTVATLMECSCFGIARGQRRSLLTRSLWGGAHDYFCR